MNDFKVFEYLKRYRIFLIILCIMAGIVSVFVLQKTQTYTAATIIRYKNENAEKGYAPDGREIDTTEIYSSQVMSRVFERMGLDYSLYNMDEFRSRVSVNEIITEEKEAQDEAILAQGEEVETKPTEYVVSFTAKSSDASKTGQFARQMLDEILDAYLVAYSEAHINGSIVSNDISNLSEQDYDYLEMIELLENSVTSTMRTLTSNLQSGSSFRSAATGYSFLDLYRELELIHQTEIPNIYAYILENRITKDIDALNAKYNNRIENYHLDNGADQTQINAINNIIESYVKMMRESNNTDITHEYILENVYDSYYEEEEGEAKRIDQTAEYDVLLEDYVANRTAFEEALIEIAYCEYILGIYDGSVSVYEGINVETDTDIVPIEDQQSIDEESGEGDITAEPAEEDAAAGLAEEDETAAEVDESEIAEGEDAPDDVRTPAVVELGSEEEMQNVQAMLDSLTERLNTLYQILIKTNEEYNEYAGALNIGLVTSIGVSPKYNLTLYVALIVVVFGVIGCMGAVVIGRLSDIFDFYVYKDRLLGIPNRAACDKFIAENKERLLPENFTCIVIQMEGLKEKNRTYGREKVDDMLKAFVERLVLLFPQDSSCFLASNSIEQYVIFVNGMSKNYAQEYIRQFQADIAEYNKTAACRVEFSVGISEAKEENIFRIRELMVNAIGKNFAKPENTQDAESREIEDEPNIDSGSEEEVSYEINQVKGQLERLRNSLKSDKS